MTRRLNAAVARNLTEMERAGEMLKRATRRGCSSQQFQVFRVNYLLRTCTTPFSVAAVVAAALRENPPDVKVASRTMNEALADELGPTSGPSHVDLLLRCLDVIATRRFGLKRLGLKNIMKNSLALPASQDFHEHQVRVFTSGSYAEMLGALYGRERAAKYMLETIQESFFEPLTKGLSISEQRRVRIYFDEHLANDEQGREAQHAKAALENLAPHLRTGGSSEDVHRGAEVTLELQSAFYISIAQQLLKLASTGVRPNPSLKAPTHYGSYRLAAPGPVCYRPSAASRQLPSRSA